MRQAKKGRMRAGVLRQTLDSGHVNRNQPPCRTATKPRSPRAQPVYTFFVTFYSVGMHVQSDSHEAALAPLRRPASSARKRGNQWLISFRRSRYLRLVVAAINCN